MFAQAEQSSTLRVRRVWFLDIPAVVVPPRCWTLGFFAVKSMRLIKEHLATWYCLVEVVELTNPIKNHESRLSDVWRFMQSFSPRPTIRSVTPSQTKT